MTLVASLKLKGNPFEHYTAETEPNIADYAVRPPYLQSIVDRAQALSSFILFGDRGSGKSATRITVYNEIWKQIGRNDTQAAKKRPFAVNLSDFSSIQTTYQKGKLTDREIAAIAAFAIIEQMLAWLSSLEDDERKIYIEGLDKDERTLVNALITAFYLSVPEMDRNVTTSETFRLLNSAWTTKSKVWITKRWDAISNIAAQAINVLSKKQIDESVDISAPTEALLKSLTGDHASTSRTILIKLVEFAQAFGFEGVCVLVDKVDETPATSNSAEATAKLIHPLLAHIQLLEVPGFSWILFLWSNVQDHFNEKYLVRLDKIPHTNITWNTASLREMVEARVRFFSDKQLAFGNIFHGDVNVDDSFKSIAELAVSSPRELIKLLDFITREHDARGNDAPALLDSTSLDSGQDKYARETIGSWFAAKPMQQVLRLGKNTFVNKDVQTAFKISVEGARVRIKKWEDEGLIRQSGNAPSEAGGKPVYRYVVADARVERIITRKLDDLVGAEIAEQDEEETEE
jgi:hypothetical protein